jgi:hypothetical protein
MLPLLTLLHFAAVSSNSRCGYRGGGDFHTKIVAAVIKPVAPGINETLKKLKVLVDGSWCVTYGCGACHEDNPQATVSVGHSQIQPPAVRQWCLH